MESNSRNSKFLDSLKAIGCDVDNLNTLPADRELPKKLLKFVSGGKTGFTRTKEGNNPQNPGFKRVDFIRLAHHPEQ